MEHSYKKDTRAFVSFGDSFCIQEEGDETTHKEWMRNKLQLLGEGYENSVRGYIMPGRIQLFTGSDFRPALNISNFLMRQLWLFYVRTYATREVLIGNGCRVGKDDDIWPPLTVYVNGVWEVYKGE